MLLSHFGGECVFVVVIVFFLGGGGGGGGGGEIKREFLLHWPAEGGRCQHHTDKSSVCVWRREINPTMFNIDPNVNIFFFFQSAIKTGNESNLPILRRHEELEFVLSEGERGLMATEITGPNGRPFKSKH